MLLKVERTKRGPKCFLVDDIAALHFGDLEARVDCGQPPEWIVDLGVAVVDRHYPVMEHFKLEEGGSASKTITAVVERLDGSVITVTFDTTAYVLEGGKTVEIVRAQ